MWRLKQQFWGYKFRRSTVWLVLFMGILAGVGLASTGYLRVGLWCWLVVFFAMCWLPRRNLLTLLLVLLCGIGGGWWRGSVYQQKLANYGPLQYQEVTITVRATEDALYGKSKQLTFTGDHIVLSTGQVLTGKLQLSGFGVSAVFQGDEVQAVGKLYPGYGAYQASISFANLRVIAHHPTLVADIRRRFTAGMQTALPEPLAPFSMGLLVGQRATLPAGVKQDLLMVGLTHIIAVSGYNLTIILHATQRLLGKRSKRISTFLSLTLIAIFLLLAGASASIVRAAIVSVLSIVVGYYGRTFKPLNLIMLAAAITAWANPVYLWSDVSWYLSFLAFFGVMVLSPLIQARWPSHWHESLLGGVALESVCAEMMSLPYVLHIFGQMSLIGLPANVLVVTLVPLAMLLGLVAGVAGMLAGIVAGWFAWPAWLLLNYMLDVAHMLAGLPHIFVQNRSLSLVAMLALYMMVMILSMLLWQKSRGADKAHIAYNKHSAHHTPGTPDLRQSAVTMDGI
jgi:competence protein ComEC